MQWLRLYHDMPNDPKWRLVAVESGQPVASVMAVWTCMMVNASQSEDRGTLSGWNDRVVGASLDLKGDVVSSIRTAMQGVVLDGDVLTGWERRQRMTDSSADRVRQYRDRLHAGTGRKRAPYDTKEVVGRDGGACVYCLSTEKLCVDHMIPIILGGDHMPDNFACACKKCNSGKAGRTPEQAGYQILNADALERYRSVKARLGIDGVTVTPPNIMSGTVTEQDVTVTSAGVTVPPLRAQTQTQITEEEKEEPPLPPAGGNVPDLFAEGPAQGEKLTRKQRTEKVAGQYAEALERFKDTYPRRNHPHNWYGNSGAEKKFIQAIQSGTDPELIISAASRYAQQAKKDGIFGTSKVADALTWMNGQRWIGWNNVHELRPADDFKFEGDKNNPPVGYDDVPSGTKKGWWCKTSRGWNRYAS